MEKLLWKESVDSQCKSCWMQETAWKRWRRVCRKIWKISSNSWNSKRVLRSHPRQRLRLRTTTATRMVEPKLVATSARARVTLARMEEVPRRLRSTVISVTSTVALQTPTTPMIAASTRQTVARRDSLVERRSRTITSRSSRKSLRKQRRSWPRCLRKWSDFL